MSSLKLSFLLFISMVSLTIVSAQNERQLIDELLLRTNINRIADDIITSIEIEVNRDIYHWGFGKGHVGISMQYGVSIIGNDNSQIAQSRTSYWQYIQANVGHRFLFFNKRLSMLSSIKFGPSNFHQKATLNDSNLEINNTYEFSKTEFTIQSQIGIGYRLGKSWGLELMAYLPLTKSKLTQLGAGLSLNIMI
ncbi:hypothetical protein [uncultured Psychroserpens sp.]|uniref:hypothetical protein n=1 Tax=uncultured Psychroserpens sp. TaxID=255436 RepID=UPI00261EFC92|nr:hypothetical protein [uncultured Psychroserpens sp.]